MTAGIDGQRMTGRPAGYATPASYGTRGWARANAGQTVDPGGAGRSVGPGGPGRSVGRAGAAGLFAGLRRLTARGDRGSAVADFAMVGGLLSVLFLAAFQIGLALHIRNTMIESVAEGARYGARADATPAEGAARARELIVSSVSARYATNVTASRGSVDGVVVVTVRARAPLPVLGLLGPSGELTATAHAFAEDQ